jgi:hypothetical protein
VRCKVQGTPDGTNSFPPEQHQKRGIKGDGA